MFKSTLFSAAGGTINASGGSSAGSAGGNGRYLVSENSSTAANYGSPTGASEHFFSGQAARDVNPFIETVGTTTFNIAGLQGGADVYGLMSGVSASDSFFDDIRTGAPANAVAALVRTDVGPTGDQYLGEDHLLLVNLTETPLNNPTLGLGAPGSSFEVPLLQRGFANNPAFGGSGATTLTQLPAESVYATLVGENEQLSVNASVSGAATTDVPFNTLDVVYLTTTFHPGDFDHDGNVDGDDFLKWQRGESPAPSSASDLAAWRANFGFKMLSANSQAVPEPSTLVTLFLIAAIFPRLGGRSSC
jgi:hypothetical protein